MRLFLGLDGGGTKTECVLLGEDGTISGRSRSGPSNPYRVGVDAAVRAVESAAQLALAEAQKSLSAVRAVCAGLAGVGDAARREAMQSRLGELFPAASVRVMTDLEIALASLGAGPAIVLVAGTGSAATGRDAQGRIARSGGRGPWIGDEGSAFDIGRDAVRRALAHRDQMGTDSALGIEILRALGETSWDRVAERAAAAPDEVFPRIFPVVASAAGFGDSAARDILCQAATALAELAERLAARLGLSAQPVAIALMGGMLGRSTVLDEALRAALHTALSGARIVSLPNSPAETAARLALEAWRNSHGNE
jgi:N-acetylglucosamine kinase-like BadF-type ATPase